MSPLEKRFWVKVNRHGPIPAARPELGSCWVWTAARVRGYGRFSVGRRMVSAHRMAVFLADGKYPPAGMDTDHLCRNHACVRRSHLEVVTHRVNNRRGVAGQVNAARQRAITHCPRQHEYTAENTPVRGPNRSRTCRTCERVDSLARYRRRKQKA